MRRCLLLAAALIAAAVLSACPPVDDRLDVTPSLVVHYFKSSEEGLLSVDAGAYIDLEYAWKVGPDYLPPDKELRAFVHFRDATGKLIEAEPGKTLQDDHDIKPPPRKWRPGQAIIYPSSPDECRLFKIPANIGGQNYIVTVWAGLYDPETNRRARLSWPGDEEPENREYQLARFHVGRDRVQSLYPEYDTTWNGPEHGKPNWRWSKKVSTATFLRYPAAEAADLVFAGHSPAEEIGGEQHMSIYIHEKTEELRVTRLTFDRERIPPTRVSIPKELFSHESYVGKYVRIIFEVDELRSSESEDAREELGFEFHEMVLLPKEPQK